MPTYFESHFDLIYNISKNLVKSWKVCATLSRLGNLSPVDHEGYHQTRLPLLGLHANPKSVLHVEGLSPLHS